MKKILVKTQSRHYPVVYQRGGLAWLAAVLRRLGGGDGVCVLSSHRVWRHWGGAVARALPGAEVILFDDAERAKNLASAEKLWREMARRRVARGVFVVAVGGGVVGDVAGFVAASYLRGVRLVHVPTTLVAQVDSAIGGKTGVNLPEGKNLVGAFYQPEVVLADPLLLATLPPREFRSGLYEVIKYGILGDAPLAAFVEQRLTALQAQDAKALDWVIPRCIATKAGIVSRDERESGLREVLNLGHTYAHALEAATAYRVFLHGEAVGWGLIAASRLAVRLRLLPHAAAARIAALVNRVGPRPPWPSVAPRVLIELMSGDKKVRRGRVRFVLPQRIGKVRRGVHAPPAAVLATIREIAREGRT